MPGEELQRALLLAVEEVSVVAPGGEVNRGVGAQAADKVENPGAEWVLCAGGDPDRE
jgi:hypothetical protein